MAQTQVVVNLSDELIQGGRLLGINLQGVDAFVNRSTWWNIVPLMLNSIEDRGDLVSSKEKFFHLGR